MKTDTHPDRKNIHLKDIGAKDVPAWQKDKPAGSSNRVICPALADAGRTGSASSTAASQASPATKRARKKHDDQLLDETLEESFPASDPPSSGHIT